ncbi:MAG: AAA family ATPase [Candidatus Sumerlaeia bacterium]|nr:AAA family ATPase [Candidatus Sumerlaeia bacterium]
MTTDIQKQAAAFRQDYERVFTEIQKVMVGQNDVIEGVLICLFAGGNVLLEGVPGLGKTMLIRTLGEVLDLPFSRIQFTPDLMPADIIGTNLVQEDPKTGHREFVFQRGPLFSNLVLADEINRATPKTQSAMLEAMQEKRITAAGVTHELDRPFFVMATQNPLEMEGTYPLPEAQLDRFLYKVMVPFPSRQELHEIVNRTTTTTTPHAGKVMDKEGLLHWMHFVRSIVVAPHVQDYAVRLLLATHPTSEFATDMVKRYVRFGGSPRGAQALILTGKIKALRAERYNVAFADIAAVAKDTLRHRLILNFEGEAEGITSDMVIEDMLKTVAREAKVPA